MKRILLLAAVAALLAGCSHTPDTKQRLFRRVFGPAARFDRAMIAKVKAAKPGEYVLVDTNGDGKHEEAWFIDACPRNTAEVQPILVRAIDRDGDLDKDGCPDMDSDLYLADWKADGTVDAAIEYLDTDGDNDLDQMAMYSWSPNDPFLHQDALRVWWLRDDGNDNQLSSNVNYIYDDKLCQNHSHFGGDETCMCFGLTAEAREWQSVWENPFLFYDADHDGRSDESLRLSGMGDEVEAARWSWDADDDAHGLRYHDYDFSITTVAAGSSYVRQDKRTGSDLHLPADLTETLFLEGIRSQPFLRRDQARQFVRSVHWARAMLTWDELNSNTDPNLEEDPHERWEGVIAHGNQYFPKVGGQGAPFNRRFEVSLTPKEPMGLYYSPSDARVHMTGARVGWMDVDFDLDGRVDAHYEWVDKDKDGYFDERSIDLDGDGTPEFVWPMAAPVPIALEGPPAEFLRNARKPVALALEEINRFVQAAQALSPELREDPVARFFLTRLDDYGKVTGLGTYVRHSDAGRRYYLELLRDRALAYLRGRFPDRADWKEIEGCCARGDLTKAAALLERTLPAAALADTLAFRSYRRRLPLLVEGKAQPEPLPVSVPLRRLRERDPAFDPADCAVVRGRWLDWQEIPHQVDEADGPDGPTLSFMGDPAPPGTTPYYIYYAPRKAEARQFASTCATAQDWEPGQIGWESQCRAYHARRGQFGFIGKDADRLVYPTIAQAGGSGQPRLWVDALQPGKTSGLGGLTLYLDGQAYPVQDPSGERQVKFTQRQVCSGPVRSAVEITASGIVPAQPDLTVHLLCITYASRTESEIRASVSDGRGSVLLAPGLCRLPHEDPAGNPALGILGSWGRQTDGIGEIGLAVLTDPHQVLDTVDLPDERQIRCRPDERGGLRYWIIGDWRRGRTYPVAPNVQNWKQETALLADRLLSEIRVQPRAVEQVKGGR